MVWYERIGGDILVLVATRNFDLALVVGMHVVCRLIVEF